MSLKHILNDDPTPPLHISAPAAQAPVPTSVIDPALMSRSPSSTTTMSPSLQPQPFVQPRTPLDLEQPPPPRGYSYQPVAYQGAGGGNYYSEHDDQASVSPPPFSNGGQMPTTRFKEGYVESNGRRKRKHMDDDEDYHPPGQKRHSRRHPPRTRQQHRAQTPASSDTHEDAPVAEELSEHIEEDMKLSSSDLEDCEELWTGELGNYIVETHKRQKQVDAFFSRWIIERDSLTAYQMSHSYRNRIARIPLPPPPAPPPPPPPPVQLEVDEVLRHVSPPLDGYDTVHGDFVHADGSYGAGPETVAREMDDTALGVTAKRRGKGKGKESKKRVPPPYSDSGSEDIPISAKIGPAHKKRRVDKVTTGNDVASIADEFQRSIIPGDSMVPSPAHKLVALAKGKGKGRQREHSVESVATTPKPRRKPGPRKKYDTLPPQTQEYLGIASASVSVAGDTTPVGSRPASPALTVASATLYELDEAIPPLKRAKRVDEAAMLKRVKMLEEAQRKVWTNIARKDVAKVYKYHSQGFLARQLQCKRIADQCSSQARRPLVRTIKSGKDVQVKGKRLMREMLVFWKKNEKEERDVRKREQKEASDRAKIEEEKREAARQARKLEFLISQTELYSHFVGNKLKTAELEGGAAHIQASHVPAGAHLEDVEAGVLQEIDFDEEDPTNIHQHARANAQAAIALAKQRAEAFDTQAALERKTNEALKLAKGQAHIHGEESVETVDSSSGSGLPATPLVDLDSDELNFQNPTSLSDELTIKQPKMLMATLKEYQLKGLNWLATLYEQGINGILADEMGLGKTVQSISLLAYLAETHDIWGPFLVVSPASTLHNWQQEITRFVPGLKALPYWGNVKDRTTLRKCWNKKEISYDQDAPFHVLITSYQLVLQDQQYFSRVKWQYMILDEAQNIKNSSSNRWKTLLGFQCRNRLLLTGTPIQNSMQELWALLHFIMPSLFDSHDEFNEWFSKDIENAAENKGSKLNEHQLRRLHMILKPFMLRRVKRHVQNELPEKIEIDVYVDLSARQRALYKGVLAKVSVADLLQKAASIGKNAESTRSLMNLVMQFRKICNHPELLGRADVVAPFSFAKFGQSGPLIREGDTVQLPYSTRNPIEFIIPTLFYNDGGIVDVPREHAEKDTARLATLMNIWSTDRIQHSLYEGKHSGFSFLRFLDMSPSETHAIHMARLIQRQLSASYAEAHRLEDEPYSLDPVFVASLASGRYKMSTGIPLGALELTGELPDVRHISTSAWQSSCLSRRDFKLFVPPVVAPPISVYCANRAFIEHQANLLDSPLESLALYGIPPHMWESQDACSEYQRRVLGVPVSGLFGASSPDQLPLSSMQIPEAKRLIFDSGKLAYLDTLLQELKAGDHRALMYFQMTRMMDLMEEYLIYRQYKYLRLDGHSKLDDRRDMVMEWQTRPDIFIFILSTRAGGLGINLTAADTVIFYDHDWNPSNDAQAMDRAHRLGQTRQVTVYRLITKGTIDERIVQLARVKKDVQDIVVGNKTFTDVTKPSEIVQLLLNEDQLVNLDKDVATKSTEGIPTGAVAGTEGAVEDLWDEDGDEFFGPSQGGVNAEMLEEEPAPAPAPTRGRKRKDPNAPRKKPGPKAKKKAPVADEDAQS
ncbi:Putative DNA helicase [Sparassis crispa]|uniref:Chromatin-remodeling ATPase INO80 n=1 Tax=Sparassis crispa TaxID=139825 RepID=A0A401G6Y6_9APHY|nr:Putative DNA helicase [Sparassis crispa]GBE77918.1 Putative DNA helicase [Sparassis crispa]